MIQKSLFDNAGQPEIAPPKWVGKLARSSDPLPSQAAAAKAVTSGLVEGDCEAIVRVLREARERTRGPRGSLTAKEIAKAAGWMLGDKPDNVRVSRRMASLEVEQKGKDETKTRPIMVVATGLRRSFDKEKEPSITSYALADLCCGNDDNWVDTPLHQNTVTRECRECGSALGTAEERRSATP